MSEEITRDEARELSTDAYLKHLTRDRHPGVREISRWFAYTHLDGTARSTSGSCAALACDMIEELPDGPELTTGLRKLLEAKDCFVRAAIAAGDPQ